jgi:uncharacterized protein YndB with AHSA1/START domain
MSFQDDPATIRWRIHTAAPPEAVYRMLTTDTGRAAFWAESAVERDGVIHFHFPDGQSWQAEILESRSGEVFSVCYFGDSRATFRLIADPSGGTRVELTDQDVPPEDRCEVIAGWVSVLLALKAAVDFDVDLRNHDPQRSWAQGYAEN